MSAGEASGDHHAARLVRELLARRPDVKVDALGGPHLEAAGARILFPLPDLAVMGFAAVFQSLGKFIDVLRLYARYLRDERPDAVVLVDYPGLHVRFAALAKRQGIPVVYFVCPQLWAWAPWRARRFERAVDRALAILPFEVEYFRRRGIDATYVGHPAADSLAEREHDADDDALTARARASATPIALLPGSRPQEARANLPLMLRVARRIVDQHPDATFFLPMSRDDTRGVCASLIDADADAPPVVLVERVYPVLGAARFALVASGTATFEVAYHGVPMVVIYKITPLHRFLGGQLLTVPWISQVNLIAGEELVPEFVTPDDPVDELTHACLERIGDTETRSRCVRSLSESLRYAFAPGASSRAAEQVVTILPGP